MKEIITIMRNDTNVMLVRTNNETSDDYELELNNDSDYEYVVSRLLLKAFATKGLLNGYYTYIGNNKDEIGLVYGETYYVKDSKWIDEYNDEHFIGDCEKEYYIKQ